MQLTEIRIYPVKSLGTGILVNQAVIEERGLQNDRRWMLVDANDCFMTQRQYPQMALVTVEIHGDALQLVHRTKPELGAIRVPLQPQTNRQLQTDIWGDEVAVIEASLVASTWLSVALGVPCRLMYQSDSSPRLADQDYTNLQHNVSLSDGFPYLIVGQNALEDLNGRLDEPVEMARFRPNLVFSGGQAYEEDNWFEFEIGAAKFLGVKPCARCVMTTVNPEIGVKSGNEPLKTLSTYRQKNNKIYFGQNTMAVSIGATISVGDEVRVTSRKQYLTL